MQPTLKDAELEKYFQDLFEMYPTAGWKRILEDMTRMREFINNLQTCVDAEEMHHRQGQLFIIDQILTHQDRSEAGHALALQEQEGTSDAPTGGRAQIVDPMS
jgi:hypothetical protein